MKTVHASVSDAAAATGAGVVTLRSSDGGIAVRLQRTKSGVFVQRWLQQDGRARVQQATRFASPYEFRRWCDADAIRFQDPLMMSRLVRCADELFNRDGPPAHAG